MNLSAEQFKAFLNERRSDNGDPDTGTVLEFLWSAYSYVNPVDNAYTREKLDILGDLSERFSFEEANLFYDSVADLCFETERMAFLEGVRVGSRLILELNGDGKSTA